MKTTLKYRKYREIDVDLFKSDIKSSSLFNKPSQDLTGLTQQFDSVLRNLLIDTHAPEVTKTGVLNRP